MPHDRALGPKIVAITGASSGIGAGLAEDYAQPGVVLALAGRNRGALEAVAARCEARGARVFREIFDVSHAQAVRRWFETIDELDPVDLVIANAGISSSIGPDGEPEPWPVIERVVAVNLLGAMAVASVAAERMRARRSGRIVLMGSLAGLRGLPFCPAYSASKAGLIAYGEALRDWLTPCGVGVTVVAPGYVVSPMSARVEGRKTGLVPLDRAVRIIRRGIERNRPMIAFPLSLYLGTRLLALLPARLARFALGPFRFTVRRQE
jgi:short-subunit dehydrogenase